MYRSGLKGPPLGSGLGWGSACIIDRYKYITYVILRSS